MSNIDESGEKFESMLTTVLKVPGVRVDRKTFLKDIFISRIDSQERFNLLLEEGPIAANVSQLELNRIASSLISKRTNQSTSISFISGLPGGVAMAATIPGDILQFFGTALRMAQELAYLYGSEDLWNENAINDERVMNQLTIYLGVMFGVSGSTTALKLVSSGVAKQMLKKLPQKALTKTFYYPIIKKIAQAIGVKMTKNTFAKGVSKAIPVIGGVLSGGMTYVSMKPMGKRLKEALEEAQFTYTKEEACSDFKNMGNVNIIDIQGVEEADELEKINEEDTNSKKNSIGEELLKYKQLLDMGAINQEEFNLLKNRVIEQA